MNRRFRDSNGDIHFLIQGEPEEGWVEITNEEFIPDPNYVIPYGYRRMNEYPDLGNQLDMIWHELNTSGSLTTTGEWFTKIKEVKDTHPKE